MKCAVISVSLEGAILGARVKDYVSHDITLYERKGMESGEEAITFTRTLALTDEIFSQYDGILYIMACGIVVRAIAPHVKSKAADPAVLVMDECGKHCISLLSGHLGGANIWAKEVAAAVGADPVITTATDVHGAQAPDDIAREWYMRVDPISALKPVNSSIAQGKPFLWVVDEKWTGAEWIMKGLDERKFLCRYFSEADWSCCSSAAVFSERNLSIPVPHVYLRPRNVYVGIGCKRGTSEEHIRKSLGKALDMIGAKKEQIISLSSVDVKSNEQGLLAFVKKGQYTIHFYTPAELGEVIKEHHLEESAFVKKTIGVGNICEAAAMKTAQKGKIILRKTKLDGVTIALIAGNSM